MTFSNGIEFIKVDTTEWEDSDEFVENWIKDCKENEFRFFTDWSPDNGWNAFIVEVKQDRKCTYNYLASEICNLFYTNKNKDSYKICEEGEEVDFEFYNKETKELEKITLTAKIEWS